jgi:hypothetical protein
MRAQILGVDALHTKDVRQTHNLLVNHLATIRRIPIFSHCKFVLIFECASHPNRLPTAVRKFSPRARAQVQPGL